MKSFIIEGGHPLQGTITPQGAKNEALEVICAALLTDDPVRIDNIPDILDVKNLINLLVDIGVKVTHNARNSYTFQADELKLDYLGSVEFVKKCASLRGSVLMIGPLLGRFGKATVAKPGGDKIGRRRLDTHFLGFKNLGATFEKDPTREVYHIHGEELTGKYMLLDEASVTGTANIIMADGQGDDDDLQRCLRALYPAALSSAQCHGCQYLRYCQQPADHRGCGASSRS